MVSLVNWNDEIRYEVPHGQFKTPTQVSEVQAAVRQAYEQGQRLTVVGAMHSTTECTVGTGTVISMKNFARVLEVDKERLTVTVEGGVTLHQLCGHLKELDLQPPVVLEWGNFQIGAISGTHANDTSMKRSAQFSSYVLGVKLVTPSGEIMEISESQNAEYLPAIRSHFGMLGVVYEVTVRIFKTQPLHVSFQVGQIDTFMDNFAAELQALKADNDQVFGMLFANTGELLWQCRKFLDPAIPRPSSPTAWLDSIESKNISLFGGLFLPLVKAVTALRPSAEVAGLINNAMVSLPLKIIRHSRYIIDPCDRGVMYAADDPNFEFYDWVFPEGKWCDMIRAFLQLSDRFRRQHDFILPLPALVYFIKQDRESLLSRSRSANMMAIDPEYPDPKEPKWKEFRLAFNEVAVRHGGIPHINKTRDGAISHFAQTEDQESIRQFLAIRQQLDPKGLFLNDYFKTMFANYL
ncbi:FAD-linked oxidoreductase [Metarhizium guizhouense ARSEF 977]|uniref:D-arabinono-1,4-lactone oxidase n=1 Tax=Metarhizium guizhouense (strain ARSEF 977) TaxID=1276136 RepID=A0A0B4GMF0_METGA|nr:FAD-linked oxidoreductase [Metarhizium guizhouense ARSEF 977]